MDSSRARPQSMCVAVLLLERVELLSVIATSGRQFLGSGEAPFVPGATSLVHCTVVSGVQDTTCATMLGIWPLHWVQLASHCCSPPGKHKKM